MIHVGDCLSIMRALASESVQTCITSPPYYGLRDYGVEGQHGLEETPEEFVSTMVAVFREVRRLLRDDGTLWLNLGDSYAGSWGAEGRTTSHGNSAYNASVMQAKSITNHPKRSRRLPAAGELLKPKDLIGIPWRVAFALQADGWYLRQDIIWSKPNPMPESVRDRCTKAHEYLFLLTKSQRYYFDADAIKEPSTSFDNKPPQGGPVPGAPLQPRLRPAVAKGGFNGKTGSEAFRATTETRNKRSVWHVPTTPFKEAHFATFPESLIEPCVLAGSRPGDLVFDPYFGAGTTGVVSERLGRRWEGCELNPDYVAIARRRLQFTPAGLPLAVSA